MTRLRDRLNLLKGRERPERDALPEFELDAYTLGASLGALDPARELALAAGAASTGLGGWTFFYRLGWKPTTDRQRAGLLAMKKGLIANGFGSGIDISQMVFGNAASNRTIEFQKANGLDADGVIGPKTARRLFAVYFEYAERQYGIPDHLLAKTGCGESNDDPIAEGFVDPEDEGILQFHLPFWPGVTLEQALDPLFEIDLGGRKLRELRLFTGSWKAAVAGWNIGGTYAKRWREADYPATGGPTMGTDSAGNTIFAFERATAYWNYIEPLPYR